MKTVLVTGGGGFIGSNIVAGLSEAGDYKIIVCDRFGNGEKWRNLVKHAVDEIIAPEDLFFWLQENGEGLHAIIHMASISNSTEKNIDQLLEVNFSLSRVLWKWAVAAQCRFIYGSAAATYGDGSKGFDDDNALAALSALTPISGYGYSKHLFDQYVVRRVAGGEAVPPQWAGLKFFSVYGPNEYHKEAQRSAICQLALHAAKSGHVKLFKSEHPNYKDGEQSRDFIYVKDSVDVVMWLLNAPHVSGIFNCGTGQARSFNDLANALFAAVNKPPHISYVDMPEVAKQGYQYHTQATTERLRAAGYTKPFTSLEDGVREYVQNHLLNNDPYR